MQFEIGIVFIIVHSRKMRTNSADHVFVFAHLLFEFMTLLNSDGPPLPSSGRILGDLGERI